MKNLGLIAGSGIFPRLVAKAARSQGFRLVAVAHVGETDAELGAEVDALHWVRVGQVERTARLLRSEGVHQAMMAGGIHHVRAITQLRPDWGAFKLMASVRSFRDDAFLRALASYFEEFGISIVAPTELVPELLAPEGHLAGDALSDRQNKDVALGLEIASALGRVDVGQTVVVKGGHVLALEAVEGTDEAIRRGGKLGGPGAVVVKLCKPGQDTRFDLPAVGPKTLLVMEEVGACVLAVEAGKTLILESDQVFRRSAKAGIKLVGVRRQQ